MVKRETTIPILLSIIEERLIAILAYSKDLSFEKYLSNRLIRQASRKDLEDIGDACKEIIEKSDSEKFSLEKEEIKFFKELYAFRAKSTHGYDSLDFKIIFEAIKVDIPRFKKMFDEIRERKR